MNTKKTLILAALLGAAVLYLTKVMLPQRERTAGENIALGALQPSHIKSIDVIQNQADSIENRYTLVRKPSAEGDAVTQKGTSKPQRGAVAGEEKDDSVWEMPALRGALLDHTIVTQIVGGLRALAVEGPIGEKDAYTDLSAYGLSKPELTAVVHENSGKDTEIAFGKKNQYLSKRYVKISGRSGIYLVDDASFETLNKSSSDVRSKNPFKFDSKDVREVLVQTFKGIIKLEQPVVGEWRITDPAHFRASSEDVEALLKALQDIKVSEFIDGEFESRDKYGFTIPRVFVKLDFREGIEPRSASFFLANSNTKTGQPQQLYATASISDTIFKLDSDPSPAFSKGVDDLRFKRIVDIAEPSIEKIVATTVGGSPVTIVASGIGWTVNGKEGDPIFVQQLLQDVSSLKAESFPASVPADAFQTPFLVLSITKKDGDKQTLTLTVGKEFKDESGNVLRYAKSSIDDTVYVIRDIEAKRVVPHEETLLPTPSPQPTTAAAKAP